MTWSVPLLAIESCVFVVVCVLFDSFFFFFFVKKFLRRNCHVKEELICSCIDRILVLRGEHSVDAVIDMLILSVSDARFWETAS